MLKPVSVLISFIGLIVIGLGIYYLDLLDDEYQRGKEYNKYLKTPISTTYEMNQWFPVRKGDFHCIVTNYTYNKYWLQINSHTVENNSWCSPQFNLVYFEEYRNNCACAERMKKEFPIGRVLNCSVNHDCSKFREWIKNCPVYPNGTPVDLFLTTLYTVVLIVFICFGICFLLVFMFEQFSCERAIVKLKEKNQKSMYESLDPDNIKLKKMNIQF